MQVLFSGRERTEEEFRLLLKKAILKISRIIETNSSLKIIEAVII